MRIEELFFDECNINKNFVIEDNDNYWDYAKLYERIMALRIVLRQHGIKKSEKIAIICDNSANFFIALIAGLSIGAVVVPIDKQLPIPTVKGLISQFDIRIICFYEKYVNSMLYTSSNKIMGIPMLSENHGEWYNIKDGEYSASDDILSEEDPAIIFLTSGTSGKRKGVVLTHNALTANIEAIYDYINPNKDDIFFITKTINHVSTLVGELLMALKAGCKVLAYNPMVSPVVQIKRMYTLKPTIVFVNPTILKLLTKANFSNSQLSSVRSVYTSGAVIDKKTIIDAERLFRQGRIFNVYGLTEAGPRVAAQNSKDMNYKYCSVGKPIMGVEVIIKSDNGTICKHGESGNMYVKTSSMMLGYYNDVKSTKKKIQAGWLDTGDVGYFDSDGYLYVIGRKDDMIIHNAYNVDPNWIESIVSDIKDISECIVFGIDSNEDNKIICAIKRVNENSAINPNKIIRHCLNYLAPYECPQEFIEWNNIPKTYNGKLSRRLAVERYFKENR
ncbi:long-chain-fatty-acid--CoA ligase [Vallitalea longa]|uniref:Long-chain-fatty-acid--CoA ligase n=1 Tax=Vallitalea longa TaxID=2936439 RepID=A0A9W5YBM4_9FIRM|nr:class I adenylate-forming enzyme family protein [Vallitalea longa]GKX31030.1 long-chain-fatty-acid--CoA ligase [Vallitalea longa]